MKAVGGAAEGCPELRNARQSQGQGEGEEDASQTGSCGPSTARAGGQVLEEHQVAWHFLSIR